MRYTLELLAVFFSAATGPLVARNQRIDLFGVIVLGLAAAVGGGTLRDLVLDVPVFWLSDPNYIWSGILAAVGTFFLSKSVKLPQSTLLFADAAGLAFVTILGTAKTLGHPQNYSGTVCVLFGVMTGVAGGMIRDLLIGQIPLVFRQETYWYATTALIGSTSYVLLELFSPRNPVNLILGTLLTLAIRLAAVRWKLRLPEFVAEESDVA